MRVFRWERFEFRIAPPEPMVITTGLPRPLLEACNLMLKPANLIREALNDPLLHIRGVRTIDGLCARSLLKQANNGCRAAQLSPVNPLEPVMNF
jgi:hypothetical protein